ncbi:MAG TPA: histidine--tRNA ligase [Methanocorpusculum sp.]|nr:histidine--tRNA ligase [Methanocorpusculum sp.]
MQITKPRGTRDFFPNDMLKRRYIEQRMRDVVSSYGYGEVMTPMFESQELFTIKSGEGIISEMFTFEDKGGRKNALRPEITAAVVRAYVNEGQSYPKPIRWYYFSECFRYERPQKGRYRQFWQFGCELIGADSATADAEIVSLAYELLKCTGVRFTLKIGHLAPIRHILSCLDQSTQKKVMQALDKRDMDLLKSTLTEIGHIDLYKLITDLISAKTLDDVWTVTGDIPERNRIEQLFQCLNDQNIPFTQNFGIARGLDYYTGMVFEGFADNLGAENQILGGGVYQLSHLFGGTEVPSCGFAIGFDRVMVSIGDDICIGSKPLVSIVSTPNTRKFAYTVAHKFRLAGISTTMDLYDRGFSDQIRSALKSGASHVVLIGDREANSNTVTLKNLLTSTQTELSVDAAISEVISK